jgi:hypothetical protein
LLYLWSDASIPSAADEVTGMSGWAAQTEGFAKSATMDERMSPIFSDVEVVGFGLQVRHVIRGTFGLNNEHSDCLRRVTLDF